MTWTPYARRLRAKSMYWKGKSFIAAAIRLREHEGYEYVVLHLACMGIEITLKGLLLLKDFKRYEPKLKAVYGHNLTPLVNDALSEFGLFPAREPLAKELDYLSSLYVKHLLRYGSFFDILVDPNTIKSEQVLRRLAAALRLAERELTRQEAST